MNHQTALGNNSGICLREHHNTVYLNAVWPVTINKFDNSVSFEIIGESVF